MWTRDGVDSTAFVVAFKGVLLEGLEVAFIVASFGTFWALEGLGVSWPGGDGAIPGLLGVYLLTAATNIAIERRHARRAVLVLNPGGVT